MARPWRTVVEGDWAFGAEMQSRVKYEQILMTEEFGKEVTFGFDDGARYVEVVNTNPNKGYVVLWFPDDFICNTPSLNSINIDGHGVWLPHTRLIDVIKREFDMRALAYTKSIGDAWLDDPFDLANIHANVAEPVSG